MNINFTEILLATIAVLLFSIDFHVGKIDLRMRERFSTDKEQDSDWAKKDVNGERPSSGEERSRAPKIS
jgi:hypothetical protein